MIAILKTASLPTLFLLPWIVIKINDWENAVERVIQNQPVFLYLALFPSVLMTIKWLFVKFGGQKKTN